MNEKQTCLVRNENRASLNPTLAAKTKTRRGWGTQSFGEWGTLFLRGWSTLSLHTVALFFMLLCLLPMAGCGPKPQRLADQPVAVRMRAPKRVQEPVTVSASGAVEANVTAQAAFQIAGRVARVLVDEGQAVKQGQVLAELDATDYRNGYEGAAAQAAAAQAVSQKAQN